MYQCTFCGHNSFQREWQCGGCGRPNHENIPSTNNTDLRMQIAIVAMGALLHGSNIHDPNEVVISKSAFKIADEMIKQSKEKSNGNNI